jgi:hypothetical protein
VDALVGADRDAHAFHQTSADGVDGQACSAERVRALSAFDVPRWLFSSLVDVMMPSFQIAFFQPGVGISSSAPVRGCAVAGPADGPGQRHLPQQVIEFFQWLRHHRNTSRRLPFVEVRSSLCR